MLCCSAWSRRLGQLGAIVGLTLILANPAQSLGVGGGGGGGGGGGAGGGAGGAAGGAAGAAGGAAVAAGGAAGGAAGAAAGAAGDAAGAAGSAAGNAAGGLGSAASGAAGTAGNAADSATGTVSNALSGALGSLASSLGLDGLGVGPVGTAKGSKAAAAHRKGVLASFQAEGATEQLRVRRQCVDVLRYPLEYDLALVDLCKILRTSRRR